MIKFSLEKFKEELIKRHLIDSLGDIQNAESKIKKIEYINLDNDIISEFEIEKIEENIEDEVIYRYVTSFKNDKRYILSSKKEYEHFLRSSNIDYEEFIFSIKGIISKQRSYMNDNVIVIKQFSLPQITFVFSILTFYTQLNRQCKR
ncbi:hypothetical protein [Staphylococcus epidermidis]|uniref:hypothetical protein n=1 Tax=Staphylococcus epidermidis TaxID=1282 RepID=UPI0011A96FDB|nr:hypothetical protein [Staphylococcus epidermidis]